MFLVNAATHYVLKPLGQLVLGDAIEIYTKGLQTVLSERATADPQGVGVVRLGPWYLGRLSRYLGRHYVLVTESSNPAILSKQLTEVMALDETDSRAPYNVFNYITGSTFFLSMAGQPGLAARKQFAAFLTPKRFRDQIAIDFQQLLQDYFKANKHDAEGHGRSINNIFDSHLFQVFSRTLLGLDITPEMIDILNRLNELSSQDFLTPQWTRPFNSKLTQLKTEFDTKLRHWLLVNFDVIKKQLIEQTNNLLITIIRQKLGADKAIVAFSENDLAELTNNPDVRACIAILMPVQNFRKVISEGFDLIARNPILREQLQAEALQQSDGNPVLDAVYREALRSSVPADSIVCYTAKGLTTTHLAIPPNAMISVSLKRNSKLQPALGSSPEIKADDRSLTQIIELGLGARRCPAFPIADVVIKEYLHLFSNLKLNSFGSFDYLMDNPLEQLQISQCHVAVFFNVNLEIFRILPDKIEHNDNDIRRLYNFESIIKQKLAAYEFYIDTLALNVTAGAFDERFRDLSEQKNSGLYKRQFNALRERILNRQICVFVKLPDTTPEAISEFTEILREFSQQYSGFTQGKRHAIMKQLNLGQEEFEFGNCIVIKACNAELQTAIEQAWLRSEELKPEVEDDKATVANWKLADKSPPRSPTHSPAAHFHHTSPGQIVNRRPTASSVSVSATLTRRQSD